MTVRVRAEAIDSKLHRLQMFIDGIHIGEYERAQEADIDRKTEEIKAARAQLLELYERHGPLVVRWDRSVPEKAIRRLDGARVGAAECSRRQDRP